MMRGDAETV